jgi:hypothetical protein
MSETLVYLFKELGFPVNRIGFEAGPYRNGCMRGWRERDLKLFCWNRGKDRAP